MERVENPFITYCHADTIQHQGTRQSIQKYINEGYYVSKSNNGNWLLTKTAKVLVTLKNSKCTCTFDVKEDVLKYYGRKQISESLIATFQSDVDSKKIYFEMNEDGTEYDMK